MRRLASILALLIVMAGAAASAQKESGPTYDQVVLDSKNHTGKIVTWIVRTSTLGTPVAPEEPATPARTVLEVRDDVGGWRGRLLLAPPVKEITVKGVNLIFGTESMSLQMTGVIEGMAFVKKGALSISVPLLRNVALEVLPAELEVYTPGQGITWPQVVRETKPKYTRPAMGAKIEGSVELQVVVRVDGSVGDVIVTKSLEPSLDKEAIAAAKQWKFKPGLKDGQPVPTRVSLVLEFRLH